MLHFEFGQDRLTESRPLDTFELAKDASHTVFLGVFLGELIQPAIRTVTKSRSATGQPRAYCRR